tara:strand:- start:43 stop:870 length:828 start_codon:yes stop_codon:yes gene_type:complete
MFAQIRGALSQSTGGNSKFREIMKLEVGNIYTVRLVPNVTDPAKTFFHYYTYAWNSFATGQFTSNISPQTWGERDPIAEARYSLSKHGTDEEKDKASKVMRRENWLANVYVVSDPTNRDNEGQVKLLRFGKQLYKIIMDAVEGDDADEFGVKIFDLSPAGCSLKIKVERQGDYPTYVSSRFASPSKLDIDDEGVQEVLDSAHDLESVFPVKSYDELKKVLDEHFYCKSSDSNDEVDEVWNPEPEKSDDSKSSAKLDDVDPLDDDKVKKLLEGLDG